MGIEPLNPQYSLTSPVAPPCVVRPYPASPSGQADPESEGIDVPFGDFGLANSLSLCPSGHRMGLRQDANRRVSSAAAARLAGTSRRPTREHSNDKRTLVIHSLVDGRSSWAVRWPSLSLLTRSSIAPASKALDFTLCRGRVSNPSMSVAPPGPTPTRFGRQHHQTSIIARPMTWRRPGRWKTQCKTTADAQRSRSR